MKITIIGAGNVGTQLCHRFVAVGAEVHQVFSRDAKRFTSLSKYKSIQCITDWQKIDNQSDIYILAVSDSAIAEVAEWLQVFLKRDKIVVHTSGTTPSKVLAPFYENYGVFYPLQTFSTQFEPDFDKIPILVDANKELIVKILTLLGKAISPKVSQINDQERAILHIAAVFVNNFSNFMFTVADEILQKEQIDFELLKPLIQETVNKIQHFPPQKMQTGPAIRNDKTTIQRHLDYLKIYPQYRDVYAILSKNIIDFYQKNEK